MDLKLQDKVALITGSSRGIGLATDQAARLVEAAGGRALPTAPTRIGAARSSAISFRPCG